MDVDKLHDLLVGVQAGSVDIDQALARLRTLPFDDLGYARLDTHRALRQGVPEVVFCQGKTSEQIAGILERLWQSHDRVLGTRATAEQAAFVRDRLPDARYDPMARLITLVRRELPVAEEAAQTLEFLGRRVVRAYDVGVAGIHRLLSRTEQLVAAEVIITVAGMEGALTSVVAGLVNCPVIGVPTSVGYGAHFGGVAPLLTMLNSCALGVAVVNIDNGFGAAVYAHTILKQICREGRT
jgi:hypothetical protein